MEFICNTRLRYPIAKVLRGGMFLVVLLFFSGVAQGQELHAFIEEAVRNNPTIQAFEKKYAISAEKISEVNSLPNTQFSGGFMLGENHMPMTMPEGEFTVMQMFPWFGTLGARGNYATAMAEADFLEIEIAKRKIAMTLSQSYYRLYELAKKQLVLDANQQLLKVYEQLALSSVEVGKASAVSVLRLQMRQNDLSERKLVLAQEYEAELVTFNKIMNREKISGITWTDSLTLPEQEVAIDMASLSLHPELAKYEELQKVVLQADALNKKESAPDLGLGVNYMLFKEAPNMLMPMVSVSIPIFNKKYKSISKQNKLKKEELTIQKQASQNTLVAQLQTAIKKRDAARISLKTHEKNLSQARNATEILFKNFETGTIDFREVLEVQELQLNIEINQIEAIGEYFKQQSIVDYFIK